MHVIGLNMHYAIMYGFNINQPWVIVPTFVCMFMMLIVNKYNGCYRYQSTKTILPFYMHEATNMYGFDITCNQLRLFHLSTFVYNFRKDCEEPLDRQNMYVFLLVPAVSTRDVIVLHYDIRNINSIYRQLKT